MIILEYCPEGICIADAKAMDFALSLVPACNAPEEQTIKFGNDMILSAVRVLVKRGQINHKSVKVTFETHTMIIDGGGVLNKWPHGFCDYNENFLMELMR